jgi:hypothetical protein
VRAHDGRAASAARSRSSGDTARSHVPPARGKAATLRSQPCMRRRAKRESASLRACTDALRVAALARSNTVRFDFPTSTSFNEGDFRNTVASYFKVKKQCRHATT